MYDRIERLGNSAIQHGPSNNRIYLMKLDKNDYPGILRKLDLMAAQYNYTKIFAKIPEWAKDKFKSEGYLKEASIPNFYDGKIDTFFYSKFIDHSRSFLDEKTRETIDENIRVALSKQGKLVTIKKDTAYRIKMLGLTDIPKLAALYTVVFKSYPFPIFEKSYLKRTMNENVKYFGIFNNDLLIAASSAEMDVQNRNAEMTDFATNPRFKGNNLSLILLMEMEAEMRKQKIKTAYTIARSFSPAMNITFAKRDYNFSGTLINNTNISGNIESMNIWHKSLI